MPLLYYVSLYFVYTFLTTINDCSTAFLEEISKTDGQNNDFNIENVSTNEIRMSERTTNNIIINVQDCRELLNVIDLKKTLQQRCISENSKKNLLLSLVTLTIILDVVVIALFILI